jgi:hypothetical protein
VVVWPNLGFHQPTLALVRLGHFRAGSFGVVHVLMGDLKRMCIKLQEISQTLVLVPRSLFKNKKVETKGTLLVREPGSLTLFELKYFWLFFNFIYTMRLTQTRLN